MTTASTMTLDPYTKIHKALRRDMFECLTTLGVLDLADADAVAAARVRANRLLRDLDDHGAHEDEFLGPLLVAHWPEHAALLASQHRTLDQRLARVHASLASAFERPDALLSGYRELGEFVGGYLEHLAAEERALPELARRVPRDRLAAALAAFGASRSPAQHEQDLRQMLPALNRAERVELLQGMLAAPEPAATAARAIARAVLGEHEWSAIEPALTLVVSSG